MIRSLTPQQAAVNALAIAVQFFGGMCYVVPMTEHEHILIVGDEPALLKEIERLSLKSARKVLSAETVSEALTEAGNKPVDLVVVDVATCHREEGGKLADVLRQWPAALLILLNEPGSENEQPPELPKDIHAYLRKPYHTGEIQKTIDNALAYKRLAHAHEKSEIALLESKGRLANLVVNALVGIAIIQNNTIVCQNPAQKEIFEGLSEPVGLADIQCVHAEDLKKVKAAYQSIIEKKTKGAEMDFRFTVPDRRISKPVTKTVQCRASAYQYQGENAILLNMMDITHARELENLMMIKGKMASLGRVATGIAHEIRNPLTGINSYLFTLDDIASQDSIAPESLKLIRQITSQIQVASNRIESVIKRVLDFSRPNKPTMEMININDAAGEAITLSAVTIGKMGITLEQNLQEDLLLCYGDTHLIGQVILNLLNNAAKAVEKNEGDKKIQVASFTRKGGVFLSVADSGPGIPKDMEERIFDPFFTTSADGAGIGLSISQRIVTDHGGTLAIGRSALGGADFIIEFPVEKRMYPR